MAQPAPPVVIPNPITTVAPVKPPIATLPTVPPKTTVPPISTTVRTKKPPTSTTPTFSPEISEPSNKDGGASGMSGGAVAGLVIGIIVLLVCSVIGGFMLLKKRRKRMMGRGRYNGYPDTSTSQSRDLKQRDDDDDASESKRQGGSGRLWGLVTGVLPKTHKSIASPGGGTTIPTTATGTAAVVVGPTPPPMQQIQHSHSMRAASPTPPVPAPNWGTASLPPPPSTLMGNAVSPATPVVGPNYGVNSSRIGSNYPSPGNNINNNINSHALISQPLYMPPTPQDQQLTWKEQQQLQQLQLQQQQSNQQPNQQSNQPQQQQLQQQQFQQQQQQQLQQQHIQQQLQHHHQQQQQQHQLQHMPAQGYGAAVPLTQPSIMVPQQHQSYQQQQPPVQIQHLPRSMVLPSAATPTAQPYYYQPGTGLVSVPLSLPPPEPYTPQPFQPMQAVTVAPSMPYALNNAHYPASLVSVSHVPPPPPPQQQQPVQQHVQQQPVQQHVQQPVQQHAQHHVQHHVQQHVQQQPVQQHAQQQPVQQQQEQQQQMVYQPPPPATTQVSILTTAALAAAATPPRPVTPESGSIYLPGDSSRLLLSQGLYKIVPDAEDEEDAARATDASTSLAGPTPVLSMDLNLGGDFLSSVLNYSNHQGPSNNNFNSLSQRPASIVSAEANGGAGGSGVQRQAVRHQPGYHDRDAGQKDRPKNQPRFLVDKEEYVAEEHGQNGVVETTTGAGTTNGEPVIVGSDIVFEPLPSVKAARARDSHIGGLDATGSSSSSLLNNTDNDNQTSANGSLKPKGASSLTRAPTLGSFLPTMGTEEYLERTDDKEEYSVRLHGARESSMSPTPTTNVVHPARLGELSKEAEGGIVDISSPIIPNTIVTSSDTSTSIVTAETVIVPPRSSTPISPPPLRLSTKPKFT